MNFPPRSDVSPHATFILKIPHLRLDHSLPPVNLLLQPGGAGNSAVTWQFSPRPPLRDGSSLRLLRRPQRELPIRRERGAPSQPQREAQQGRNPLAQMSGTPCLETSPTSQRAPRVACLSPGAGGVIFLVGTGAWHAVTGCGRQHDTRSFPCDIQAMETEQERQAPGALGRGSRTSPRPSAWREVPPPLPL